MHFVSTGYQLVQRMAEWYCLLQDEKSRRLFWDRLQFDICPTAGNSVNLYIDGFSLGETEGAQQRKLVQHLQSIHKDGGQILLYGAGICGKSVAMLLNNEQVPFDGFCDRCALSKAMKDINGKPVYAPQYLFQNSEKCYVIITTNDYHEEIFTELIRSGFPKEHILPYFYERKSETQPKQYFEFPMLYEPGTAFVDVGCFDGSDSAFFSRWSNGNYSKIIAFEPDPTNAELCKQQTENIENFELYPYGLGRKASEVQFAEGNGAISHVIEANDENNLLFDWVNSERPAQLIRIVTLDEMMPHTKVGFIKMDIEGGEMDALYGAQNVLMRDKPLLAISIYHKSGDMLAIMDYLHSLVPDYRFWIRHYTALPHDTVLYASVKVTY